MNFGDIVLVQFPYSDTESIKRRPALVIWDSADDDVLVCRITSRIYHTEMDVAIENWKETGLLLPSVIRVHKMASLAKGLVERTIGQLDETHKIRVLIVLESLIQKMKR